MTRFSWKANENLYSSSMVDTKETQNNATGSRGDGNKCCGTPTGLDKIVSRESRGYVAHEI